MRLYQSRTLHVRDGKSNSPFVTSSFSLKTPVVATDVASLRPLLLLLVVRLCCLLSAARCAECFHCTVCSVFLFFLFFPTSPPPPLRQNSGSLRPFHRHEPVRLLFWLLARFVGALAPYACEVLSTRIHHAFFHHVMCLFDTSLSSYIEFVSFFASTHFSCVVTSFASSCPSWASISSRSP